MDRYVACGPLNLGTQVDGMVLERTMEDGRAEITGILHTTNALTVVWEGDPTSGPISFGGRPCDVKAGATPALGRSQVQIVFVNPSPGYPLPDLAQLFAGDMAPGQEFVSISIRAQVNGPLREGFGVVDGTPGHATVVQINMGTRTPEGGATADGFPVERIDLKLVGRLP